MACNSGVATVNRSHVISSIDALAGQLQASSRLARALSRPTHAYLFAGPAHSGKRTAAKLFAQALLCDDPIAAGCGHCPQCLAVLGDRHPDLRFWDIPEGEKTFKVEQVRELIVAVARRPYQGRRSVHILPAVDATAPAGANALLKTLEEPPPTATLILLARDVDAMLPTLVSRCQVISFGLTPTEVIEDYLRSHFAAPTGSAADHFRRLAVRADGRIGRAIELASTIQSPEPPVDLPPGPGIPGLVWADKHAAMVGTDQQSAVIALVAWLRDAAWLSAGGGWERVINTADAERLRTIAPARSAENWIALAEAAELARDQLERHANARLVFDKLARAFGEH
jgi:DNA polymerase-3 subunit delta'